MKLTVGRVSYCESHRGSAFRIELQARERFHQLNLIAVSGTLLFQRLPLSAAVVWGPDLGVLLPAVLLARVSTLLMLFLHCRRNIFLG